MTGACEQATGKSGGGLRLNPSIVVLSAAALIFAVDTPVCGASLSLALATAPGGITISGSYNSGFGNMNGLGIGTRPPGWSVIYPAASFTALPI